MKSKIYKPCPKCGFLHLTTDEECPHCAKRAIETEAEVTGKTSVEELPKEAAVDVVINEEAEDTHKESITPIATEGKSPKDPKNNGKKGLYAIIAVLVLVIVSLFIVIMQERKPTIAVHNTTLQSNTSVEILTQAIETAVTSETPELVSTTKKTSSSKIETTTQKLATTKKYVETTTRKVTEPITAARPNVKVIVNSNKIYDPLNGTAELVDYQVSEVPNSVGIMLQIKIKVMDKNTPHGDVFCVPCASYDANGTLLYDNNAYIKGWEMAEKGDILKGTFQTYYLHGDVATIEIG